MDVSSNAFAKNNSIIWNITYVSVYIGVFLINTSYYLIAFFAVVPRLKLDEQMNKYKHLD